jgi:hypothetical protein
MSRTELRPEGELGRVGRGLLIVALILVVILGLVLVWAYLELRHMTF